MNIFISLLIFLFILNPYTIYGRPGIFISITLSLYGIRHYKKYSKWLREIFFYHTILFLISMIGVASSVFHNIPQFNHPYSVISLLIIFLTATGIWQLSKYNKISTDILLKNILYASLLNYIIVIIQLNYDPFRTFIENFLIEAGNINYTEGFRYRGLSASGGAGLSLLAPVTAVLALHLYTLRKINLTILLSSLTIIFFSSLVIGRTGLVLSPIGIFIYLSSAIPGRSSLIV